MTQLISPSQSAFVSSWLITNNVLVAHELLHFLNNKRQRKKGVMTIKLHMSKTYDMVDWDFLEVVIRTMGLSTSARNLIMHCVRSVTFSIRINGVAHGHITSSHSLRQGDPLSLFLFLLVTKGLIALLIKAEDKKLIKGIKIYRATPSNHYWKILKLSLL